MPHRFAALASVAGGATIAGFSMAGAMPGPIIIIRLSSARLPTAFSGVLESRAMARPRARPAQPPRLV